MDEKERLKKLKKYMLEEFGVTPENIDEKLSELRVKFYKKITPNKSLKGGQVDENENMENNTIN